MRFSGRKITVAPPLFLPFASASLALRSKFLSLPQLQFIFENQPAIAGTAAFGPQVILFLPDFFSEKPCLEFFCSYLCSPKRQ
jgi:hypothetical protein